MRGAYCIGVGAHQAHQGCQACHDCNGRGGSVFYWGGSLTGITIAVRDVRHPWQPFVPTKGGVIPIKHPGFTQGVLYSIYTRVDPNHTSTEYLFF